jgi:hypothetical protein
MFPLTVHLSNWTHAKPCPFRLLSKGDTYILNKRTRKPVRRGITKEYIDGKKLE